MFECVHRPPFKINFIASYYTDIRNLETLEQRVRGHCFFYTLKVDKHLYTKVCVIKCAQDESFTCTRRWKSTDRPICILKLTSNRARCLLIRTSHTRCVSNRIFTEYPRDIISKSGIVPVLVIWLVFSFLFDFNGIRNSQ